MNVPESMRLQEQWINWSEQKRGGGLTKIPKHPDGTGANAKSNDPETWGSYEQAAETAAESEYGIGFIFSDDGPFVGLDIDAGVTENEDGEPVLRDWVPDLDAMADAAFIEYSPSGTGLHVYFHENAVPEWWTNQDRETEHGHEGVELYEDGRFFTVTGDHALDSADDAGYFSSLVGWLKDVWREFNPEEEVPAWEQSEPDERPTKGPASSGETADVDVGIYDIIRKTEYPPGERRGHPYHKSDTGSNFQVDEDEETWRCWSAGHKITGHAGHLLGIDVGVIECGEWSGSGLMRKTWREIYDRARDAGYDIPDKAIASSRKEHDTGLSDVEAGIEPTKLLDALDVNDWSPSEVVGTTRIIRGQVAKRSERKLRYDTAGYFCMTCETPTAEPQSGSKLSPPSNCSCGDAAFVRHEELDITTDYQRIRLQELPENSGTTTGDTIDIDLLGDLVGRVTPGDRIVTEAAIQTEKTDERIRELYGTADGIHPFDRDLSEIDPEPYREHISRLVDGTAEEYDEFPEADGPHDLIRMSVAPSHQGDSRVKEALMYELFAAGTTADNPNARAAVHVLLVGDPSTAKSALLRRVRELMPRGIYTNGEGTSGVGLTAAAVRDQFGDGGWTLEAGALVQADGGIAAIDELDKMESSDRGGVLECMSDQQVSVAKAGMNAVFPAKTTVLAAANPDHGRFDASPEASVVDQIGLAPPVYSRFDLKFIMTDDPNPERDEQIARRMLEEHPGSGAPLDDDTLRAYIRLGRSVDPELTEEAKERITEDYLKIRDIDDSDGGVISATPRSMNVIRSLSIASARIRLSDTVTIEDVERATALQRASLADLGFNPETGEISADRFMTGGSSEVEENTKDGQVSRRPPASDDSIVVNEPEPDDEGGSQDADSAEGDDSGTTSDTDPDATTDGSGDITADRYPDAGPAEETEPLKGASQAKRRKQLVKVIRGLEEQDDAEPGASVGEVLNEMMSRGMEHATAQNDIQQLKHARELYEPENGRVGTL